MSPLPRRFLAYFLPVSAAVAAVVGLLLWQDLAKQRLLRESEGLYGVNLHAAVIASEFGAVESDLRLLAEQEGMRRYLAAPVGPARGALAREYRLFCERKGLYDQVRFLDAEGAERIRVNYEGGRPVIVGEDGLQRKADRYYFREALALARGQVYASPFDLNVEQGAIERPHKPMIRFATPVFDAQGRKRGIVVLNYLGARLLAKLGGTARHLPGRLLLLNADGAWLRGPRPEDEWAFMLGGDASFARDFPRAWRELLASPGGRVLLPEGLFAFRTLSPLGEASASAARSSGLLRVVYFLPTRGLYAESRRLLRTLAAVCLLLEAVLGVALWLLCKSSLQRESHQRLIAASEARLRALSQSLIETQERERRNLSRDLHDDLGQMLTAACLEIERALSRDRRSVRPEVLEAALANARAALDRLREISARLRPRVLDDLGLKEAVRSLLDDCRRKTGLEVEEALDFESRDVSPAVSENLYRILQEALSNAVKHARSRKGLVRLRRAGGAIELTVKDWGVGLGPGAAGGRTLGLLSMRERCELLGGSFSLSSQPGRGTEIRALLPVASPEPEAREG